MSKVKGFVLETVIYGFANMFSRMFAFFLIPLYTKHLDKIQYSNLNMMQTSFTLLTFLFALNSGVFFYYYEYNNLKYKRIVFSTWIFYQLMLAAVFAVALFLLSPYLAAMYNQTAFNKGELILCISLIGLQFFPFIFNNTLMNYYRIDRKPRKVLVLVFSEALFTFIFVYLSFQFFTPSIVNILISQIFARCIVTILNLRNTLSFTKPKYFSIDLLKKMIAISWPYFLISSFNWGVQSFDKFIGVQTLSNKQDVAILALANQLVIPLIMVTGMVNQAIGPFIMSERKEENAGSTFQKVFELTIFTGTIVAVMIIGFSPFLIHLLANKSYLTVLYVLPIMVFASIVSMMYSQFCPGFTLVKKNFLIAIASISGSMVGVAINYLFMRQFGLITAGVAQFMSYFVMVAILYIVGKRLNIIKYRVANSLILAGVLLLYVIFYLIFKDQIIHLNIYIPILFSIAVATIIVFIYFKQQNLAIADLVSKVKNQLKRK